MADVALIHAGIADSRMWRPQLESFAKAHRVIAPDLPGFGATPGIDGHEWSAEVRAFGEEEESAIARGDLDAAVDANLRLWLAGPRRTMDAVDPKIRELVREMQRNAFELQQDRDVPFVALDPPASQRLAEVGVPTLVVTGDEDVADIHVIADKLAAGIPGAERATIARAAHLPSLERPDEFDRIVLAFLEQHGV